MTKFESYLYGQVRFISPQICWKERKYGSIKLKNWKGKNNIKFLLFKEVTIKIIPAYCLKENQSIFSGYFDYKMAICILFKRRKTIPKHTAKNQYNLNNV